jgi:4-amino-4-deoxy-L-arabinose transferase-like glycosyltransferase
MDEENGKSLVFWLLLGALIIIVASVVLLSWVPPVSKDELVHHLAVPKWYLKHGGMVEIPFMDFSYYPMNVDLLYLLPLYFGNDILPKFIHFGFALLTAWLIFRYLKKRTHRIYALFGALFFLSIPIIVKLSMTAYIDLGIIFFSTGALLALMRWVENGFRPKFLVLSGVLCGLGLGTKYNGLLTLLLLTLLVPFLYSRAHPGGRLSFFKAAAQASLFFLVSVLVFSPWMIRNYAWKKNPIYPLYDHRINPPDKVVSGQVKDQEESSDPGLGVFVIRKAIYHEQGWEIALVPLRVFFGGQDGSPKHFDGQLNPFLLMFSLLAFWRMKEDQEKVKTEKKVMLSFAVLFLAIAFFTSDLRIRYIAPIIPPMVILSVLGIAKTASLVQSIKGEVARFVGLLLVFSAAAFALMLNGLYVLKQFESVQPLSYISGEVGRDEYIATYRPEYPAMKYINENLPSNALVSFLFLGKRGYYCDRNYVYGESQLGAVIREARTPENILGSLDRLGITHLLLNDPLLQKWVNNSFNEEKLRILSEFFLIYTKICYANNNFYVLSLEKPLS